MRLLFVPFSHRCLGESIKVSFKESLRLDTPSVQSSEVLYPRASVGGYVSCFFRSLCLTVCSGVFGLPFRFPSLPRGL